MIFKKIVCILILAFSLPFCSAAQNLSLIDYKSELGGHIGKTTYFGQIGGGTNTLRNTFGIYYRKALYKRFTISLNYEYLPLGANDSLSKNMEIQQRGFNFYRTFHEISFSLEYFFKSKNPYQYKMPKINPYIAIGMGYILNLPTDHNNFKSYDYNYVKQVDQFFPITTIPMHIGIQYAYQHNLLFFSEINFRFTSSDLIDHFGNAEPEKTKYGIFMPTNLGNDKFISFKIGFSKIIESQY